MAEVKVSVEKKGVYLYWFTYEDAKGQEQVTLPLRFKGKGGELDAEALGKDIAKAKLYVMNSGTGNVATTDYTKPADPTKPTEIKLKQDDFQYVRDVKLKIVSEDGAPLEAAVVNITDGMNTPMKAVVTPADEGIAEFKDVATGQISVKVDAEGLKKTIDSDIELPEKRESPGFDMDIKVAGDVNTIAVAADKSEPAGDKASARAEKKEKPSGGGSSILQALAGLIFLGVIAAVAFVVVKAKGLTAEGALRKMGVQLPQDQAAAQSAGAAPAEPAVDPSVCQFCGQKKDASGNCSCSVGVGASPFATPSASNGVPKLVGSQGTYSGHIFEISGDSAVIGREAGNDIAFALSNDSTVSRRHATISKSNGDYFIRDEGSSNGTFVNGAKITSQKLTPGDEVQIGGTKFRFEV